MRIHVDVRVYILWKLYKINYVYDAENYSSLVPKYIGTYRYNFREKGHHKKKS